MSFAGAGADSRTTQVFVTYRDGTGLGGALHEVPFGKVIEGMENIEAFYAGYGDTAPFGSKGPVQGRMWSEGNSYLKKDFEKLDYINECHVIKATDLPQISTVKHNSQEDSSGEVDKEQNEAHASDLKLGETDVTSAPVRSHLNQSISPIFVVAICSAVVVVLLALRRSGYLAYRKLRVL